MSTLPITSGGQSRAFFVDHEETYGRHVLDAFLARTGPYADVLDLGCGSGDDLALVRGRNPTANLVGIDFDDSNRNRLDALGVRRIHIDIERDELPIADASLDLIIANQVLEHTKEIFWINDQMARKLRVGGTLFIGVPNICSLHNRILLLLGQHPTQWKAHSAHVRPFSRHDLLRFYDICAPGLYRKTMFRGSQFYPFPKPLARIACRLFPGCAFSIFLALKKTAPYNGSFLRHPVEAQLQTNFWLGPQRPAAAVG